MSKTITTASDSIKDALALLERCMATVELVTVETQRTLAVLRGEPTMLQADLELDESDFIMPNEPDDIDPEWRGVLPEFKAPMHRYAIAMADGQVVYIDKRVGTPFDISDYMVKGEMPHIEDLGPI